MVLAPEQESFCRRIAGCCRLIYNSGLEQRKVGYTATGRGIGYVTHTYYLKEAKAAPGFEFLRDAPAHCLQQALRDLDDAYRRFFSGQNGYPQPRRRGEKDRFRFPDPEQFTAHTPGRHNQVRLPKLGWVSVRNSYPRLQDPRGHPDGPVLFEGELKHVTVTRGADGWYLSFCCEVEVSARKTEPPAVAVGIDRGVANSVALSSGQLYRLPLITDREWTTIGSLQTIVNRRQKGSSNWEKAVRRLGRCRQRLARRKQDALQKLTTSITLANSLLALEDLAVKNMSASARGTVGQPGRNVAQKARLNRAILDHCWGEMRRQFEYKARWYGREVWVVPPKNSSNECRSCGHVHGDNRESQAVFVCKACGHEQHADVNAAQIVLARAERGKGKLIVARPSGGPPGCGSFTEARNACVDPIALKTPERSGPSRKNPARAGNPTVRLPHAA